MKPLTVKQVHFQTAIHANSSNTETITLTPKGTPDAYGKWGRCSEIKLDPAVGVDYVCHKTGERGFVPMANIRYILFFTDEELESFNKEFKRLNPDVKVA